MSKYVFDILYLQITGNFPELSSRVHVPSVPETHQHNALLLVCKNWLQIF